MSTVGVFFWQRGLKGPEPVKMEVDLYLYRSRQPDFKVAMIGEAHTLVDVGWQQPLDTLAKSLPCPEMTDG